MIDDPESGSAEPNEGMRPLPRWKFEREDGRRSRGRNQPRPSRPPLDVRMARDEFAKAIEALAGVDPNQPKHRLQTAISEAMAHGVLGVRFLKEASK